MNEKKSVRDLAFDHLMDMADFERKVDVLADEIAKEVIEMMKRDKEKEDRP